MEWGGWWGLNPRPSDSQSDALTNWATAAIRVNFPEKATEVYEKVSVLQFYFVFFVFLDRMPFLYFDFLEYIWLLYMTTIGILEDRYIQLKVYRNTIFSFLWTNNIYSSIEYIRQIYMTYDMLSSVGGSRYTPWATQIFIILSKQVEFYS